MCPGRLGQRQFAADTGLSVPLASPAISAGVYSRDVAIAAVEQRHAEDRRLAAHTCRADRSRCGPRLPMTHDSSSLGEQR